jgi:hypothetical protein
MYSARPLAELPGVDSNGIRPANVCGPGSRIEALVTQEGKHLWLTGQSGASTFSLQEAMNLLLAEPATCARVISHLVPYRALPRVAGGLADS